MRTEDPSGREVRFSTLEKAALLAYALFLLSPLTFRYFDVLDCRMTQWIVLTFLSAPIVLLYLSFSRSPKDLADFAVGQFKKLWKGPLPKHHERDTRLFIRMGLAPDRIIGIMLFVVFLGMCIYLFAAEGTGFLRC